MAVENKSKSILNVNLPENYKNKVYVNPYFNRQPINNLPNNAVMHVNPKFSHLVPNFQCNAQNKNKIYVNPNFIKSNSNQSASLVNSSDDVDHSYVYKSSNSTEAHHLQEPITKLPAACAAVARSRYSLIRQNVENKIAKEPIPDKAKHTFKVNKYKSVPLLDIKRNLDNVKTSNTLTYASHTEFNSNVQTNKKYSSVSVLNANKNKFMFINYNCVSGIRHDRVKTNISLDVHKKRYKPNQMNLPRVKKVKGNLKKNNIPCPLFRKFGKCLRNSRGMCEFLHDKKHVSVCRKFIKGLCHDKDCLLSHDLTTKKMPTCYFYLKGTCTKTDCPYLHVKLNEKAKVCPDFLKGYCENGSKCLKRHISVSHDKKNKRTSLVSSSIHKINYPKIKVKVNESNLQKNSALRNIEPKINHNPSRVPTNSDNYSEHRYYQEHQDDGNTDETCEIIKPTRCKLGTLPSYIQL